jgi:hypothetical protein
MNPAPDADLHSVGAANFEWIVNAMADLAIAKAKLAPQVLEMRWAPLLGGAETAKGAKKPAKKKSASKKVAVKGADNGTANAGGPAEKA